MLAETRSMSILQQSTDGGRRDAQNMAVPREIEPFATIANTGLISTVG